MIARILAGPLIPVNVVAKFGAKKLRAQIADIRKKGYVVTREETFPGVFGVGVPILAPRGRPLGSIAMAGPLHRMTPKGVAGVSELLIDIGRQAAARIAGSRDSVGAEA